MFICTGCYEMYQSSHIIEHSSMVGIPDEPYSLAYCPKIGCNYDVVEIDDLIAPSIIELNKKGYRTQYCCSGHWYEDEAHLYIAFDTDYVSNENFVNLPDCFYIDSYEFDDENTHESINNLCIRSSHAKGTKLELMNITMDWNKKLYEWTLSLPKINEDGIKHV